MRLSAGQLARLAANGREWASLTKSACAAMAGKPDILCRVLYIRCLKQRVNKYGANEGLCRSCAVAVQLSLMKLDIS